MSDAPRPTGGARGARAGGSAPSLQARALRLLAQREHSRLELERKLQRFIARPDADPTESTDPVAAASDAPRYSAQDLSDALDALQAKGFIQPERVAQSVLHRRAPKLGSQRVLQELRQKGLDEDLIRNAAATLRSSEHARAWAVWQRKFGQVATTPQERAKHMRFLASRGFAAEVVGKVVRGQAPEPGDEAEDETL
ncbi:MAG: RecX family transcriptional regulator [Comamonas sp.]|nr:RecX family transcriptional regulator [Comamonas sp.]